MRLSCLLAMNFVITLSISSLWIHSAISSWIHSHFDNVMTKLIHVIIKVPLTPKTFFPLIKSTSFADFFSEKIISIDKHLAFLQAFE